MEQYNYWRLVDARVAVDQRVEFYGVVVEYELPRPTTARDMICTMTVADMSYDSPGLRVVVFGSKDQLPRVKSLHDIIRFHRVKMNVHNGLPQAIANKGSAFLLFDGSGDNNEPYQASSSTYTFEAHDLQILEVLRAWSCANLSKQVGTTQYLLKIRDIKGPPSYFDLCCKVLHLSNETVYVWDGTDSAYTTSSPFSVENEALPLSTLREFPPKGTILEVKVDVPFENRTSILLPQVGRWIKLRNITVRILEGKLEAVFTRESKFSILAPASEVVQESERWYEERVSSEEAGLPENSPKPLMSLTVTDFEHVPFSTLRQVVTSTQVTSKFRCLVRVRSISPARVEDFCSLVNDHTVYCVRMTLEDPTCQIHAYLFGEDGECFFNGFPAAQRDAGDACLGALQRSVERLLRGDSDEPPYVKCCIKSYYLDKQQPWTSRRFRIFGTRFL